MKSSTMFLRSAHSANAKAMNSGPLSAWIFAGYPRQASIHYKVRMTRVAGKFRSSSMAKASRLKSSITLNVRNRRPFQSASDMERIDQLPLIFSPAINDIWCRVSFWKTLPPSPTLIELHQAVLTPDTLVIPGQTAAKNQLKQLAEAALWKMLRELGQ